MKLPDAFKVLGLQAGDDPRPHLAGFRVAREHLAAMVRTAENDSLADRYQKDLIEFDQALAAMQEHLEASGLAAPPLPSRSTASPPPAAPAADEIPPRGRGLSYVAWFLFILAVTFGGGWIYLNHERTQKEQQRLIQVASLERHGAQMVENRRWQEAAKAFAQIEGLSPGSELAARGRRSIEAGMAEEQTQFIGYWNGQALSELDAGRLDEAAAAARQVMDRYPADAEAAAVLERIAAARAGQAHATAVAAAREALNLRDWNLAIRSAQKILAATPADPDAKSILADATAALEKAAADQEKARELLKMAVARDQGQFDQQALDWLREASALAPNDPEIAANLEKLASYTRTLRVPGDFATPAEALASAHDRDRIILGAAVWKGPLFINAAVELQGAGSAETRVECAAADGSAITLGPNARGARISGITFRHESFAIGTERYSVAVLRGGRATFVDCQFSEGSGHGLAVIEGGQATVSRSRFVDNGWNGAAASGRGSSLDVRDCEALNNFEHGIESWQEAGVTLINNRCEGNSRNGIHTDNGPSGAIIEGNQLIANREFGLVLDSAGTGRISGNTARANLLGGLVIRAAAARLAVTSNQATLNQGPGLVLEKGLVAGAYSTNSAVLNNGPQVLAAADLENPTAAPDAPTDPPRARIIAEP